MNNCMACVTWDATSANTIGLMWSMLNTTSTIDFLKDKYTDGKVHGTDSILRRFLAPSSSTTVLKSGGGALGDVPLPPLF